MTMAKQILCFYKQFTVNVKSNALAQSLILSDGVGFACNITGQTRFPFPGAGAPCEEPLYVPERLGARLDFPE